MNPNSQGLVCFTDGHTEEILAYRTYHELQQVIFVTAAGEYYIQVRTGPSYTYYKRRLNKHWDIEYYLINNIDHVELK